MSKIRRNMPRLDLSNGTYIIKNISNLILIHILFNGGSLPQKRKNMLFWLVWVQNVGLKGVFFHISKSILFILIKYNLTG